MTTTAVATADLEAEALGRIHNYTDPTAAGRRTKSLQLANAAVRARVQFAGADYEHAVAFSDDYDEILAAALAAVDSEREGEATTRIFNSLKEQALAQSLSPITYDPEDTRPALEFLNEELTDLMRTVRAQEAALADVATASEALRAGQGARDAWTTVEDQVHRYGVLRALQRRIVVNLTGTEGAKYRKQVLNRSGYLRAAFDHEVHFQQERRFWKEVRPERGAGAFVDWLRTPPRTRFPRDGASTFPDEADDAMDYVRWVSAQEAGWIPHIAELIRVDELTERMLSRTVPIKQREAAKKSYYDERGLTPAAGLKVSIA